MKISHERSKKMSSGSPSVEDTLAALAFRPETSHRKSSTVAREANEHGLEQALAAAVARAGAAAEAVAAAQEDASRRIKLAEEAADRRAAVAEEAAAAVAQRVAESEATNMANELARRTAEIEEMAQRRVTAAEETVRVHARALEACNHDAAVRIREADQAATRRIALEKQFCEERVGQAEAAAEQRAQAAEAAAAAVARRIADVEEAAAEQRVFAAEEAALQQTIELDAMIGGAAKRAAQSAAAQVAQAYKRAAEPCLGAGESSSSSAPAATLISETDRVALRLSLCREMVEAMESWLVERAASSSRERVRAAVREPLRNARMRLSTSSQRLRRDGDFLEAVSELLDLRQVLIEENDLDGEATDEEPAGPGEREDEYIPLASSAASSLLPTIPMASQLAVGCESAPSGVPTAARATSHGNSPARGGATPSSANTDDHGYVAVE